MRYLLDTNIISQMMRDPGGIVTQKIATVGEKSVFTSLLAIAEVRFGIEKKQSQKLAKALDWLLPFLSVEPWTDPADRHYAALRADIEAKGLPVDQLDMLLAAQALADGATMVTDNEKHFRHIPGLKVENWLR
jgi:tRNA(fMet)-specific endonuclease VapC